MNSKIKLILIFSFMIIICLWTNISNAIDKDQLVGYWTFDDKNNLGQDSSTYSNHGDKVGDVDWAESAEIYGDEIERVVAWGNNSDVSQLADKPVRLRFLMKDADLYSVRFRA